MDNSTAPPRPPAPVLRKRRSVVPVIGFAVASLLALAALEFSSANVHGVLTPIYRSIGLFTGNGSWAFQDDSRANFLFRVLAIIAPVLTAVGVTELATGAIVPWWLRLCSFVRRQYPGRRPVAIFGLTDDSLEFASDLARSEGYTPLIYAEEVEERLADRAARWRIPVIPSPKPWWRVLRDRYGRQRDQGEIERIVLPWRVEDVVSFLPGADAQVGLAARLRARTPVFGPSVPLRTRLLMADRGLAQKLDDYLKYAHENASVYPRLMDLDTLAARLLLTRHPLDVMADALGQRQIHLAIYGFGALGRAVAKEAARLYVTRATLDNVRVRVTVVDRDPAPLAALLAEDPEIGEVLTLDAVPPLRIANAGFGAADMAMVPDDVTAHVITFGDPQTAFTAAVSLRRWLLEPPGGFGPEWRERHACAPVFVRARDWTGLGRLLRSGVDRTSRAEAELPDGIYAFATRESLFTHDVLLGREREQAAKRVHAIFRQTLQEIRTVDPSAPARVGETEWEHLSQQLRDSNFAVVDQLPVKLRAIGHQLAPAGRPQVRAAWPPAPRRLEELGRLEHARWFAERASNGWRYAESRNDPVRLHHLMVPWDRLPPSERKLDDRQVEALPNVAAALDRRIAESLVIGVVGHRLGEQPMDAKHVQTRLNVELTRVRDAYPERAPVLLTALAAGADTWAAEQASCLKIPFFVALPMPFELYQEDFLDRTKKFHEQENYKAFLQWIARASYYVELPLKFGRVSELTFGNKKEPTPANKARRAKQYALAGAYIAERAHVMIGVCDDQPARGVGGTAEVLSWKTRQDIPEEYRSPAVFRLPAERLEEVVISPTPDGKGGIPQSRHSP